MDFRYPGDGKTVPDGVPNLENVNLILGVNGAGKTTALKAIALGLIAQMPSTGYIPNSLVRREIHSKMQNSNLSTINLDLKINKSHTPFLSFSPGTCCCRTTVITDFSFNATVPLISGALAKPVISTSASTMAFP